MFQKANDILSNKEFWGFAGIFLECPEKAYNILVN